jgi:hypothetical protein
MKRSALCGYFLALIAASSAYAEPATARYAPVQIQVARAALEAARAAAALGERARARHLERQAQLDARIAWAMSDAARLRAEAANISQSAERLISAPALEQASAGR